MSWQLRGAWGLSPAGLCRSSASLKGLEWAGRGEFLQASAQGRVSLSLLWGRLLCGGEEATSPVTSAQHLLLAPDVRLPPRCRFQTSEEREAAPAGFDR